MKKFLGTSQSLIQIHSNLITNVVPPIGVPIGVIVSARGFEKKATAGVDLFSKTDASIPPQQKPKATKRRAGEDESKAKATRTAAMIEANEERLRKYYPYMQRNLDRRTEEEKLNDWVIERRYVSYRKV
jgi:hypothetical protein